MEEATSRTGNQTPSTNLSIQNYLPDDIKGKGEPSYSLEKALNAHSHSHRRVVSESHKDLGLPPSARSSRYRDDAAGETTDIEMLESPNMPAPHARQRRHSGSSAATASTTATGAALPGGQQRYAEWEKGTAGPGVSRSGSLGRKLRKRIGGLSGRKGEGRESQ